VLDTSERLVIDDVIVQQNGTSIPPEEIHTLIATDLSIPSVQRLTLDDVGFFLWGFPNAPFNFSDNTSSCVAIDPQNDFQWFRTRCDENYFVACQVNRKNHWFICPTLFQNAHILSYLRFVGFGWCGQLEFRTGHKQRV
jgi:hypothetical protein